MSGERAFMAAVVVTLFMALLGVIVVGVQNEHRAIKHACGECDHVGECGDYECRAGVDDWKLKADAQ